MSVLLDEETVVLEALDFETPCAIEDSHAAHYTVACRSCAIENILCGTHAAGYRDWVEEKLALGNTVFCKRCGFHIKSFRAGFKVVPL